MPYRILTVKRCHDTPSKSQWRDIPAKSNGGNMLGIKEAEKSVDIWVQIGEALLDESASV
jgi:hypothetical protein